MMIFRQPIFYIIFSLLVLIGVLNFFALQNFWYWKIWWADLAMHFLGGLFIGLLALWLYFDLKLERFLPSFSSLGYFGLAILVSFLIGLLWEIFEFSVDTYWSTHINIKTFQVLQSGLLDSLSDISLDLSGAFVAAFLFKFLKSNSIKNDNSMDNVFNGKIS